MTATLVELRSRMSEIESAVSRSEPVRSRDFTACGMWADRADVKDPTAWVKALRMDRSVR